MLELAILVNLLAFVLIASQPLFYLLALGRASYALPGPAYVELRNRLNDVMKQRLPFAYLCALATNLWVVAAAFAAGDVLVEVTALIALAGLLADVAVMLRRNVPLNDVIAAWSSIDPPPDWEAYRARWSSAFAVRQLALCSALASLLVGAVFRA